MTVAPAAHREARTGRAPAAHREPRTGHRRDRARGVLAALTLVLAIAVLARGLGGNPGPAGQGEPRATASGPRYSSVLERTMNALEDRTKAHAAQLAVAPPDARAAALQTLAADYDGAARSLEGVRAGPARRAASDRLVASLHELARAYQSAAADTAAGGGETPDAATERIDAGRSATSTALGTLRADRPATGEESGVGDSRSDDPSDDEPDEDDNGD